MKNIFITAVLAACASFAFADEYADMAKYSAGDSLAWFHSLRRDAQDAQKADAVAAEILRTIKENKLSVEGFRLACNVLKPIADSGCVEVLKPYLLDSQRCPFVCDVFIPLDSGRVDSALKDAFEYALAELANPNKNPLPNVRENLVAAMAARGSDKSSVIKAANCADKKLALLATRSLARFSDATGLLSLFETSVVPALEEIAAKNDFRRAAAIDSLVYIADKAIVNGDRHLAARALKNVPENLPDTVYARAMLMDDAKRVAYLDALIAEGGALCNAAGRAMNGLRTFENSAWLRSKFPALNRRAKLAAMGGFMIAKDTRFYPLIAKELDNPDADIRALAIYSARFLCTDEPSLNKIFDIYKSGQEPFSKYAANVLLENPSYAAMRVLKDKVEAGDMDALEILVRRGDEQARQKLWSMFFDEKTRAPAVCRMIENTITSGQVNELAKSYAKNDAELSKEITKIIIKKMMQYRISREYIAFAVNEALRGNLPPTDPNYKFIVSKLKIGDLLK